MDNLTPERMHEIIEEYGGRELSEKEEKVEQKIRDILLIHWDCTVMDFIEDDIEKMLLEEGYSNFFAATVLFDGEVHGAVIEAIEGEILFATYVDCTPIEEEEDIGESL